MYAMVPPHMWFGEEEASKTAFVGSNVRQIIHYNIAYKTNVINIFNSLIFKVN